MNIAEQLKREVDAIIEKRLQNRAQQEQVVSALMAGFDALPKKAVADLARRRSALQARAYQAAAEIKISFISGKPVLKTAGSAEMLFKELRRGTAWYDPWDAVDEVVLAACLCDPTT